MKNIKTLISQSIKKGGFLSLAILKSEISVISPTIFFTNHEHISGIP
jgi:hypothetical protein